MKQFKSQSGFTAIEVAVVMVAMTVIGVIGFKGFAGRQSSLDTVRPVQVAPIQNDADLDQAAKQLKAEAKAGEAVSNQAEAAANSIK